LAPITPPGCMPGLRQPWLWVAYLPAYAPEFNPVEGWWADTGGGFIGAVAVHGRVGGGGVGW
jgi:hypothetical protein